MEQSSFSVYIITAMMYPTLSVATVH